MGNKLSIFPPQTPEHTHNGSSYSSGHTVLIILDSVASPAPCDRSTYIHATVSTVVTVITLRDVPDESFTTVLPDSLSFSLLLCHCYKLLMRRYCAAKAAALVIYLSQLFMHGFIRSLIWIHWEIKHRRRSGSSIIPLQHLALIVMFP